MRVPRDGHARTMMRMERVIRLVLSVSLMATAPGQLLPGVDPALPEGAVAESLPSVEAAGDDPALGEELTARLGRIRLLAPGGEGEHELGTGVVAAEGLVVPSPATLAAKLGRWIGRPLTSGGLGAMADEILIHYDIEGFPVVSVEAPEQDLRDGGLDLVIEIGRLGRVAVSKPEFGDPALLEKGMRLRAGDPLRRAAIDEQLAWYGRSAFRRPRLFVSPGSEPATADLLIALEERRPWEVRMGYENSGPELLGRDRLLLGAAGMTRGEHLIAWQTVLGMPVSSLHAHALRWEIPFHRSRQVLRLDAAFAEVSSRYYSGILPVESEGTSWALGAQQRIGLPEWAGWRQILGAGFEFKGTDQFLLFGGSSLSPGEVVFLHGKVAYELTRRWESGGIGLETSLLGAPGNLGGSNRDEAFRAYDPTAGSSYLIGRLAGEGWWSPGRDWQLRGRAGGQVADSRLLPAEQFAIGGYQTVRGAPEREVFGDEGWQTSLELLTPLIVPVKGIGFRGLGFFDHGWISSKGFSSNSLSSVGLGLRLQLAGSLEFRFDHGWLLDGDDDRSHVGLIFTF